MNRTANENFPLRVRDQEFLVKVYGGHLAHERWRRERSRLQQWHEYGFHVPSCYEHAILELVNRHYLVMSRIDGLDLQSYLRHTTDKRLIGGTLSSVFQATRSRHETALSNDDPLLAHPDMNTGNLMLTGDGISYIDLEAPPASTQVVEAITIELAKLTRWIVRDVGQARIDLVLQSLIAAYAGQESLLRRIYQRVYSKPFQFHHRWRDRVRKQRKPGEVTKYDVADRLALLLGDRAFAA